MLAFCLSQHFKGCQSALPSLVPIHGVIASTNAAETSKLFSFQKWHQIIDNKLNCAARSRVSTVSDGVNEGFYVAVLSEASFTDLQKSLQVSQVAVNSAIRNEADQVNSLASYMRIKQKKNKNE